MSQSDSKNQITGEFSFISNIYLSITNFRQLSAKCGSRSKYLRKSYTVFEKEYNNL